MIKSTLIFFVITFINIHCFGQGKEIPIWPNSTLNSQNEIHKKTDIHWIKNVQVPSLTVYTPSKKLSSGKGVIICPGGGYAGLSFDWEGTDIAKWLNTKGITAFVLKYRLPTSSSIESEATALQDIKRAIRFVRFNSQKWGINNNQIGVIGFSAGGHLASTLGTHFDNNIKYEKEDSIDRLNARPYFMALIYPVITMKMPYTHLGSRTKLLGRNPLTKDINYYSNELHVKQNTPPTFIVHSGDDNKVSVENSLLFYRALKKSGIEVEMHIYPKGGHGYALANGIRGLGSWPDLFNEWLNNLN